MITKKKVTKKEVTKKKIAMKRLVQSAMMSQWEEKLREAAKTTLESEKQVSTILSIKGKRFKMAGTDLGAEITVVIADTRLDNAYYDTPYDSEVSHPPACFAIGTRESEMAPHSDSPKPQAETCSGCVWNKYGTALTGKGKACKNSRRLAIYAYGDDGLSTEQIPILRIPPTSLVSCSKYLAGVAAKTARPCYGVVTKLSFVDSKDWPVLDFSLVKVIDTPTEMESIINNADAAAAIVSGSYDVSGYEAPVKEKKKSKMS